jgi:glycosyltransferase involved in cell wall biosynthesis
MKTDTLLTIGIPIFNGEETIEQTLQSILVAKEKIEEKKIEILISDNCSNDQTIFKINNFLKKNNLLVRMNINDSNLGYDKNIEKIIEESNSSFVWFLGCGEKITPHSLEIILEKIQKNKDLTNIVLNFDIYNETDKNFTSNELKLDQDTILFGENFSLNRYSLALSANIVSKIKWLEASKNPLTIEEWCHVERIAEMILNKNSSTLLIKESCFTLLREKKGWWSHPQACEQVTNHIVFMKNLSKKNNDNKKVHTEFIRLRNNSRSFLLSSIIYRKLNHDNFSQDEKKNIYQKLRQELKMDNLFLLTFLILINSPRKIIIFLSFFNEILKKIKNVLNDPFNLSHT